MTENACSQAQVQPCGVFVKVFMELKVSSKFTLSLLYIPIGGSVIQAVITLPFNYLPLYPLSNLTSANSAGFLEHSDLICVHF